MFNIKTGDGNRSIEGLQTRSIVEETIQQKVGSTPEAKQAVSQVLNRASQKFEEYKKRFPQLNSAGDMPEFKPNPMKAKSFWKSWN